MCAVPFATKVLLFTSSSCSRRSISSRARISRFVSILKPSENANKKILCVLWSENGLWPGRATFFGSLLWDDWIGVRRTVSETRNEIVYCSLMRRKFEISIECAGNMCQSSSSFDEIKHFKAS